MKDEYEKERAARGRLEGTAFYVGEIIGRAEPATRIAEDNKNSSARIVASQHEAWQALCTVCLHRRHGWETQHGPVRLGPRRKALREQLLQAVADKSWDMAVAEVASKLVVSAQELLTEVQQQQDGTGPATVASTER